MTDETPQPVPFPAAVKRPLWPPTPREVLLSLVILFLSVGLFLYGTTLAPTGSSGIVQGLYGLAGCGFGWIVLILLGYALSVAGCLVTGMILIGGPVAAAAWLGYWLAG